ncbi:hypothetical protein MFLAVUS_010370 [Mucor flavus]|uniref:Fanconi-associated nuclease n=1 Tax=Mucor flavus TaxID=439312 RepID=A0ABP9ZCH8_9FUNG
MPNKRKAKSTTDNNKNKQRSIVNFFNHVKKECTTAEKIEDEPVDIEHSKVETSIVESSKVEPTLVEPTTETTDEPPFFTNSMYTDEVNLMLETVLSGEQFLFDQEENRTFESFRSLADEPKHLIVRLLMRKVGWIRRDKLKYQTHISDLNAAATALQAAGFVSTTLNDINDAIKLLARDELKDIVKERNLTVTVENPVRLPNDYERVLLEFGSDTSENIMVHYTDSEKDHSKMQKLWDSIDRHLGLCIRVDSELYKLFQRLQIVYYRTNQAFNTNPMSTSILAKMSKRKYPEYTPSRSHMIWNSRDDLLRYEEALLVERDYEKSLESLAVFNSSNTKKFISAENGDAEARKLMIKSWNICEDRIGMWDECICQKEMEGEFIRPYYMRRFEAGWIYTRLLDHGTTLLAKMHEYELEALILQKLIDQKFYRLGKRGKWYQRLALVQSKYLNKDQVRAQKKLALKTCVNAIHDPKVHQIYLHGLYKRINSLERDLCIPRREQHQFDYMALKKPKERTIYGERISPEVTGKKSIWRANDGSECSVEYVAIEYYRKQGFKGLHCENGIVRMIAILLFWDVIFAPIPGVFETQYQTEPLDLRTDAFYEGRLDIINVRLTEISEGQYRNIILKVDERERPRNTVCTGINWNYQQKDILEIAECIGPSSLASLCQLLFEDFGQRQGGMPDLCCWNYEETECLFSEGNLYNTNDTINSHNKLITMIVKGPGDILSETQKLWIETLTGFNIQVEVCYVKEWKGDDVLLES